MGRSAIFCSRARGRASTPGCRGRVPLFVLALGSACGGPQDYMGPSGPAASRLASLGWLSLILFAAVTLVVWALIAVIALRKRGSLETHAPIDQTDGQRWVFIGGLVI